jgi:hypothetical protein
MMLDRRRAARHRDARPFFMSAGSGDYRSPPELPVVPDELSLPEPYVPPLRAVPSDALDELMLPRDAPERPLDDDPDIPPDFPLEAE